MKTIIKAILFAGLAILVIVAFLVGLFVFGIFSFDYHLERQMKAGQKYMDSLTDKDIQVWIQRTQKYLEEYNPNADPIGSQPVPPELKQLRIVHINKQPNEVDYVWAGGLDHTELEVERMTNGIFQFTAEYNDNSNRVIWPKQ